MNLPAWIICSRTWVERVMGYVSQLSLNVNTAVFCLLTAATPTLLASPEPAFLRNPSAHGNRIVVEFNGRLWIRDGDSQPARRLTNGNNEEFAPSFSPDGSKIAFVVRSRAGSEVHVVSPKSGEPTQLTYDGGSNVKVQGWLSNNEVLYSTTIKSKKRGSLLYVVHTDTLAARAMPLAEASEGCVIDGHFVFVKNEELIDNNRYYRGGYAQALFMISTNALSSENGSTRKPTAWTSKRLTGPNGPISRQPVCVAKRIYYLSNQSGRFNIWSMDVNGKGARQHTFENKFDIRSLSGDGHARLLYHRLGEVFGLELSTGQIRKIDISLPAEAYTNERALKVRIEDATELQISNDGGRVWLVVRGKLWRVDIASGTATCVECASNLRVKSIQLAHDERSIYALEDSTGEYMIRRYSLDHDVASQKLEREFPEPILDFSLSPNGRDMLVRSVAGNLFMFDASSGKLSNLAAESRTVPQSINWSATGRYATFVTYSAQDIGRVTILDVACRTLHYVTSGRYEAAFPVFSGDEASIFFLSDSNFRSTVVDPWAPRAYWPDYQKKSLVFSVALSGTALDVSNASVRTCLEKARFTVSMPHLQMQTEEMPFTAGNYTFLGRSGDRLLAVSKEAVREPKGRIVGFEMTARAGRASPTALIPQEIRTYALSGDGRSMAALHDAGLVLCNIGVSAPHCATVYLPDVHGLELSVDLRQERQQMFWELWRLYRDYFWRSDMNGVNWRAVGEQYAGHLPRLSNRAEFNELVSSMISELGAGHTSIRGPDQALSRGGAAAKLGGLFANDVGGLRVVEVYDGDLDVPEERSPLSRAKPPIETGDLITHVNGVAVTDVDSLSPMLVGKTRQVVVIAVTKPTGEEFRTAVEAVSAARELHLRAKSWATSNRRFVERGSIGRVGYIHLRSTNEVDMAELVRQFSEVHDRQALILDLRGNSGGNADPWILNFLQRRTWLRISSRTDRIELRNPRESFSGVLVVLVDGDTYSDGEAVAEGVRRLRLGILVGSRTSGAGIWVNDDKSLIDGGSVRIPEAGSFVIDNGVRKMVIEGHGVEPDVCVENDPYALYHGHDEQLSTALRVAMRGLTSSALRSPPSRRGLLRGAGCGLLMPHSLATSNLSLKN